MVMNKSVSDPPSMRCFTLLSVMDLSGSMFKRDDVAAVPSLWWTCILKLRRCDNACSEAQELVQERVPKVVCVGGNCKMVNLVSGLWLEADKSGFRHHRAWVPDLEFDGVSWVLLRRDSALLRPLLPNRRADG